MNMNFKLRNTIGGFVLIVGLETIFLPAILSRRIRDNDNFTQIEYITGKRPQNTKVLFFDCDRTVTNGKEELGANLFLNIFRSMGATEGQLQKIEEWYYANRGYSLKELIEGGLKIMGKKVEEGLVNELSAQFIKGLQNGLKDFIEQGKLQFRKGIIELVKALKKKNSHLELILISATPQEVFLQETELMDYENYFDKAVGIGWQGTKNKIDIINQLIKGKNLKEAQYSLIGDGKGDMFAANRTGAIAIHFGGTILESRDIEIDIRISDWRDTDRLLELLLGMTE